MQRTAQESYLPLTSTIAQCSESQMLIPTTCLLERAARRANLEYLRNGVSPILLEDIKSIHDDDASLVAELQRVDEEITRLQMLRERICTQLAVSRTMVAPIRRLPPELLAQIIVELANTSTDSCRTRTVSSTVACVSANWRAVARSVPDLWTYVKLAPRAAAQYTHIETCIFLSRNKPLHIYGEDAKGINALESQLLRLLPEASRWATLSLAGDYMSRLPRVLHCDMPRLERAILRPTLPPAHLDTGEPLLLNFLAAAPNLRQLELAANEIPWHYHLALPSVGLLPQSSPGPLTVLSFKSFWCTLDSVMPLIRQSAATLRQLRLSATHMDASSIALEPPLHMPRLESVDMDGRVHPILKLLRAPRVKSITVRRCQLNDNDATTSLFEFLGDAEFAPTDVHHLGLLNFHHQPRSTMDDGRVERLILTLRRLESLRSLSIGVGSGQCNPAMSFAPGASLVNRIREEGLLPNLTALTVHNGCKDGHPHHFDIHNSVREMVESRASSCIVNGRNVVALQRVEADFDVSPEARDTVAVGEGCTA